MRRAVTSLADTSQFRGEKLDNFRPSASARAIHHMRCIWYEGAQLFCFWGRLYARFQIECRNGRKMYEPSSGEMCKTNLLSGAYSSRKGCVYYPASWSDSHATSRRFLLKRNMHFIARSQSQIKSSMVASPAMTVLWHPSYHYFWGNTWTKWGGCIGIPMCSVQRECYERACETEYFICIKACVLKKDLLHMKECERECCLNGAIMWGQFW